MTKVLIIGGHGLLGTELIKLGDMIAPSHDELDICEIEDVGLCLFKLKPDLVINCAAIIDNRVLDKQPEQAINTNIVGAANVAMICIQIKARYVYISTDYVFKGDRGNYKETDEVQPFNFYAQTKLGGEMSAYGVKNHLIIRTSFGASDFPYKQSFIDKWSSKDYVDIIAPMIYEAALSPLTGVLNLGTERKTLYDFASKRNEGVKAVKLSETSFFTPYDTSLNLQKWLDYKSNSPVAKPHNNCRACGGGLTKYLDLGLMPMANKVANTSIEAKEMPRYPLQIMVCGDCGLSQLSVVIDPKELYSHYVYRSGINEPYRKHCREMAKTLKEELGLNENSFHVDIASNDGTLLKEFKEEIGLKVLGVDPASNLVAISEANGIPAIADFWGIEVADTMIGDADLITATNVFAHVNDIDIFLQASNRAIKHSGVIVIECPWIVTFLEKHEYDTTYFEHLSYMGINPVKRVCKQAGLMVYKVEKQDIHGGTIRIYLCESGAREEHPSVQEFADQETNDIEFYKAWGKDVDVMISNFGHELVELKKQGYSIAGYGMSAKGNTLLNCSGINTDIIDFIVDSTPEKIGKYSPGTGIPCKHPQELAIKQPDYCIILAWNFKDVLIQKAREVGFKGKFLIPIPKFEII